MGTACWLIRYLFGRPLARDRPKSLMAKQARGRKEAGWDSDTGNRVRNRNFAVLTRLGSEAPCRTGIDSDPDPDSETDRTDRKLLAGGEA